MFTILLHKRLHLIMRSINECVFSTRDATERRLEDLRREVKFDEYLWVEILREVLYDIICDRLRVKTNKSSIPK